MPVRIELRNKSKLLDVEFDDGSVVSLPFEFLRVFSPSAEVRGHSERERRLQHGKRDVGVDGAEQVGNYAVRLNFSDGHSTGIYSWRYLREIAGDRDAMWAQYLKDLEEAGLSRDA